MAAVTPSTTYRENVGSLTLHIAKFASTTDNGDTWASGIEGIQAVWANATDAAGTQADCGAGATYSSGTITIYLGEDNQAVTVFVLSKS